MANLTKDQRIIKDNPKASPYELLKLGLSEKRYNQLLAEENQSKPEPKNVKEAEKQAEVKQSDSASVVDVVHKLIPEVRPSARALPKLQPHVATRQGDQAKVKGPNGKITPLSRKAAEKFVRKNPTYKIID